MNDQPVNGRQSVKAIQSYAGTPAAAFSFHGLKVYFRGPMFKPGSVSETDMMASFLLNTDVCSLFPYLNEVAEKAELQPDAPFHPVFA